MREKKHNKIKQILENHIRDANVQHIYEDMLNLIINQNITILF